MKRLFFLLFFSPALFAFLGDAQDSEHLKEMPSISFDMDQIKVIDSLITLEEKKLTSQKKLKELMLFLKAQEDLFLQAPSDKKQAYTLVSTARSALEIITELHIEHLFSESFLQDLQFYSSIAGKLKPSRP